MSLELESKITALKQQVSFLEGKLNYYEQDGVGKLYHAMNRKANEMAELLNKTKLTDLDIDDPKNKAFERLQKIWSDAETISTAIKSLAIIAGIVEENNEKTPKKEVVVNRPFSPETVADAVGELAGGKRN